MHRQTASGPDRDTRRKRVIALCLYLCENASMIMTGLIQISDLQVHRISQQPLEPLTPEGYNPGVLAPIDHAHRTLHSCRHAVKGEPSLWCKENGDKGVQCQGVLRGSYDLIHQGIICCTPTKQKSSLRKAEIVSKGPLLGQLLLSLGHHLLHSYIVESFD